MTTYNEGMFRDAENYGASTLDPLEIPQVLSRTIIRDAVKASSVLQLANVFRMPARTMRMPVLTGKATAYWLTGANQAARDETLKQTTHVTLGNIELQAYEMAVLVRVPDVYQDDTGVDLFGLMQGEISEAIARNIDGAAVFGTNSPFSATHDGQSIYQRAVAAGNVATYNASTPDTAAQIVPLASKLVKQGYNVGGFAVQPGFSWILAGERTSQGVSPYSPATGVDNVPSSFFGKPMPEVDNGSWDTTKALMVMGDWSNCHIGIRADLSAKVFDQGVLNDDTGKVIWNAVQNDGKMLRVTVRYGFCTTSYTTSLSNINSNYPFAVLRPSGAPAS